MGDHLSPPGALLGPNSNIMIALYPETEVALPTDHLVVGGLVLLKALCILYVALYVATTAS